MGILDGNGQISDPNSEDFWVVVNGDNKRRRRTTEGWHDYYYPTMTVYFDPIAIDPEGDVPASLISYHSARSNFASFMGGLQRLAYRPNICEPTPTPTHTPTMTPTPSPRVDTVHSFLSHEVFSQAPQDKAVISHNIIESFSAKEDPSSISYFTFDIVRSLGDNYIYYSRKSMDLIAESKDQRFAVSLMSQDFVMNEDSSINKVLHSHKSTDVIASEPVEKQIASYDLIDVFRVDPIDSINSQHHNIEVFWSQFRDMMHTTVSSYESFAHPNLKDKVINSNISMSVFNYLPPDITRSHTSTVNIDAHISERQDATANISNILMDMFNYRYLNLAGNSDHITMMNSNLHNVDTILGYNSEMTHQGLSNLDVLQGRVSDADATEGSLFVLDILRNDPYKLNISAILIDVMTRSSNIEDVHQILVIPTRYIIP